jgi:predicted alpha/beta-fold hydrolase
LRDGAGIAGHLWTIGPALAGRLRRPPPAEPWSLTFADERLGEIRLAGRLHLGGDGGRAAVLIHGLGGSADSAYLPPVAAALAAAGWTVLRLHLRGADRRGDGLHHAGFTDDLPRVLAAPPLAGAATIAVVGFSLGGHLALRFAAESRDPRLAAVAAVCAPLDLDAGASALDASRRSLYRRYLLTSIQQVYAAVAARHPVPTPVERAARATSIREWDGLVVAPWFGFASAEEYYARMSVAPRLAEVRVPAWIVASEGDPLVPAATLRTALRELSPTTEVTWTPRGGHVGFPPRLDLGRGGQPGLPGQLAAWLAARG